MCVIVPCRPCWGGPGQPLFVLDLEEDDSMLPLSGGQRFLMDQQSRPSTTIPSADGLAFFKPVSGNFAHLTLMGDNDRVDFDFLAQVFHHCTLSKGATLKLYLDKPGALRFHASLPT